MAMAALEPRDLDGFNAAAAAAAAQSPLSLLAGLCARVNLTYFKGVFYPAMVLEIMKSKTIKKGQIS